MSPEDVQSVVGKSLKIKVKNEKQKTIFQNYIKESPPARLAGARAIYLRFFERKLYQIEIFYQEKPNIKTLEDFTASLSAKWNFPASDWRREEIKSVISCGDFSLVALKILNPKIELTDEDARAKVEAARDKKAKRNRKKNKKLTFHSHFSARRISYQIESTADSSNSIKFPSGKI